MALNPNRINLKGYKTAEVTDLKQCIACAMCAIMCPDSAIKVEKE
jgi:2-oxoglutarate ferredoxin oxidoreductase subunit delta